MTSSPATLLLGDLLTEESLGLRLLTGGPEAHRRRISGAHAIEIDAPSRWMAPRWVMLTTGLRLLRRPKAQRELIEELHDARIGALGFGVDVNMPCVPPALLEEAEKRAYPVFEIPLGTPFREIVTHVNLSLLASGPAPFERLPAIHRYLFDALSHEQPDTTVLLRLASLLDVHVLLFAEDGALEFATGEAPGAAIWEQIARRADTHLAEFDLDGHHIVAVPTSVVMDGPVRWIAAYPRRPGAAGHLMKPSVQAAAPLVAAIRRIDDLGREREHAQRQALLTAALDERDAARAHELGARALGFGLDFSAPVHLVVLEARRPADPDTPRPEIVLRALRRRFERCDAPALLTTREEAVVALVQQEPEELRAALREILEQQPGIAAGVGCPLTELAQVPHGERDARTALSIARDGNGGPIAFFVECDLSALLVSQARDEHVRETIARRLQPLHDQPQLYETLVCYFDNNLDVGAAAKQLFVHPNTLRHRIARIEGLIGSSLRQPATIAELHIALTTAPAPPRAGAS